MGNCPVFSVIPRFSRNMICCTCFNNEANVSYVRKGIHRPDGLFVIFIHVSRTQNSGQRIFV